MLLYVIILFVLVVTIVAAARLRNIPLRPIAAYEGLAQSVSHAVESSRAAHVAIGGAAVRDSSTITAMLGAEIGYQVAARAVSGDRPPIITVSDGITLGVAQDRIRRAFLLRNRLDRYRSTLARWYPQGPLSLAYAAGVGAAIPDEILYANILIGRFGNELMLIAESAMRNDRYIVAQSDLAEGQAVAYAVSDAPLIGEELYVGPAYLDRTLLNVGGVVAQDVLRLLVVVVIFVMAILTFLGAI